MVINLTLIKKMKTLEERIDKARELRKSGYNCAQCVTMVFDDMADVPIDVLERVAGGFGTGFGGAGHVCGAVSGMTMLDGLTGFRNPADKPAVYGQVRCDLEAFGALNGSVICRELKQPGRKPCMDLIADAITIMHNRLSAAE